MSAGCLERIQSFLLSESVAKHIIDEHASLVDATSITELRDNVELREINNRSQDRPLVSAANASISPSPSALPILNEINFYASRESLTIVIGIVGSGKSTLLRAILGELECSEGSISNNARDMAYCSQSAWLQNSTVRNIVCGPIDDDEIDERWYHTVMHACAFDEDVLHLPNQHETIIGSRGVTLSGGQRQRLVCSRLTITTACADP